MGKRLWLDTQLDIFQMRLLRVMWHFWQLHLDAGRLHGGVKAAAWRHAQLGFEDRVRIFSRQSLHNIRFWKWVGPNLEYKGIKTEIAQGPRIKMQHRAVQPQPRHAYYSRSQPRVVAAPQIMIFLSYLIIIPQDKGIKTICSSIISITISRESLSLHKHCSIKKASPELENGTVESLRFSGLICQHTQTIA